MRKGEKNGERGRKYKTDLEKSPRRLNMDEPLKIASPRLFFGFSIIFGRKRRACTSIRQNEQKFCVFASTKAFRFACQGNDEERANLKYGNLSLISGLKFFNLKGTRKRKGKKV